MEKNITHKLFISLLWLLYGSVVCVLIWGLNKGFDFSDEGFNMLSFLPNQEDALQNRPINLILGKIMSFVDPEIVFWRASRLLLLILSGFIFSFGFIKWVRLTINIPSSFSLHFFYPVIGISTLMSYAISYQVLSYNSLTLILVQIIVGLFLWHLTLNQDAQQNKFKNVVIQLSIGACSYALFLVKFPSAIILLFILTLFYFYSGYFIKEQKKTNTILSYLTILIGFSLVAILVTFIYASPIEIFTNIINSSKLMPDHDIRHLLISYANEYFYNFLKEIYTRHPIVIISPIFLLLLLRNSYHKLFILFITFTFAYITREVILFEYYKSGMNYLYSASCLYRLLILFILILTGFIVIDKHTRYLYITTVGNIKIFSIGLILLFTIPFICSIGTNVALSVHITQFVFSWVVMFVLILFILFSKIGNIKHPLKVVIIVLIINISLQIINGFVYSPYRLKPLTEQKFPVQELPRGNTILFDYETNIFLKHIIKKLKENNVFIKEQPIITLYNYAGLTYLLGGLSPGFAWYIDTGYKNSLKFNCALIQSSKMENLKKTILLVENDNPIPQAFISCLSEKGIFFNENYILIDSVQKPYEKGKILLYIPKY